MAEWIYILIMPQQKLVHISSYSASLPSHFPSALLMCSILKLFLKSLLMLVLVSYENNVDDVDDIYMFLLCL